MVSSILFFAAVCAAALTWLNPDWKSLIQLAFRTIVTLPTKISNGINSKRNPTLQQKIDRILGKEKANLIQKNFKQATQILTETNQVDKVGLMKKACVVLFFVGVFAALITQNILLLPVLSIGFTLIPLWIVRYNEFHFKKKLAGELETALSVITTSYMRLNNLQKAVEENLMYLHSPVKDAFTKLVNRLAYVDPSAINAIKELKSQFTHKIFHEWCDTLILCQSDNTAIISLLPIIQQFSTDRELQYSLETTILEPTKNYALMALVGIGIIPLLYIVNKGWFHYLVDTWPGKTAITLLGIIIFLGLNKAISLSEPIDD